ncbi:3-ketoacyl-CoA thiolase, peroxisomal isoform X2 [Enoplosus armatus]|uniref:3-ketoacyl-CoA thiolase, peroxisomal isoform X2 n=1 Tax=Enoplosus armatus TaxID=215367 RepID=UPI003990E4E4
MHRLKIISGHLSPSGPSGHRRDLWRTECRSAAGRSSPEDVVVVHGLRTAIGKAKRGAFKDTTPDELLSAVMTAVLTDVGLSPEKLGDVCVGNVLQPGAGALMARVAHFLSGFPESVPVYTVNRQCSSGLQALFNIAGAIRSGSIELGLACGITSDNVAERFGVSREKQDAFALSSQQKAARAQSSGLFQQEIVPVTTRLVDDEGTEREVTVAKDDGIRAGTTLAGLGKLRAAFKPDGSTTAGLTVADIDVFEINEAFASQAVYCVEKLGIPLEKVNPNGGAIALGHPLGCTGARQVVTLLNELRRRGRRAYGVVSMCIGTGMGAAAVFEYPGP